MRLAVVPFLRSNPYQEALLEFPKSLDWEIKRLRSYHEVFNVRLESGDALHIHWPPAFSWRPLKFLRTEKFFMGLRRVKRRGVKIIWTIHNVIPHESISPRGDLWLNRRIANLADYLIAHTISARDEIIQKYRCDEHKILTIPHGNYIGVYPDDINQHEARKKLGYSSDDRLVLFLGRIRPYKGVAELIAGFRLTRKANLKLLLVGEPTHGLSPGLLSAMVGNDNRIRVIPEFAPDVDLQIYLRAADIVAFPYRRILTSGSMILAMSFGKPCATYDTALAKETLGENGGLIVKDETPAAWATALENLPGQDELARLGLSALDKIRNNTWMNVGRSTYSPLLNK